MVNQRTCAFLLNNYQINYSHFGIFRKDGFGLRTLEISCSFLAWFLVFEFVKFQNEQQKS